MPGRVIFAMRVDEKLDFDGYWNSAAFAQKRPFFGGSLSRAYGDNIYHRDEEGVWIQEKSHHSYADGGLNQNNSARDLSSNNVLCGRDFVYWGRNAPIIPNELRNFLGEDLYPNSRSHRVKYSQAFVDSTLKWYQSIQQRGVHGRPVDW